MAEADILLTVGLDPRQFQLQLGQLREQVQRVISSAGGAQTQSLFGGQLLEQTSAEIRQASEAIKAGLSQIQAQVQGARAATSGLGAEFTRQVAAVDRFKQSVLGIRIGDAIKNDFAVISAAQEKFAAGIKLTGDELAIFQASISRVRNEIALLSGEQARAARENAAAAAAQDKALAAEEKRLRDLQRLYQGMFGVGGQLDRQNEARAAATEKAAAAEEARLLNLQRLYQGLFGVNGQLDRQNAAREASSARAAAAEEARIANLRRGYEALFGIGGRLDRQEAETAARREANLTLQANQLKQLEAEYARLAALIQKTQGAGGTVPQGAAGLLNSLGAARAQVGPGALGPAINTLTPSELAQLSQRLAEVERQFKQLNPEVEKADGIFQRFFGRFGRYVQFIGAVSLTYGILNTVLGSFRGVLETDKALSTVAATLDKTTDRATALKLASDLVFEGMTKVGISAKESGSLVAELSKALDGNAELIRAAYLPAVTLSVGKEGDQAELIKILVGLYNLYGNTIEGATTPAQAFARIQDILVAGSISSVASVQDFLGALRFVGATAKQSGITLSELVAILGVLANSLGTSRQAGTGMRRVLQDIAENAATINRVFKLGLQIDASKPADSLRVLLALTKKLGEEGRLSADTLKTLKIVIPNIQGEEQVRKLAEAYPLIAKAIEETANSAGRGAAFLREKTQSVELSLGRLQGELVRTAAQFLVGFFQEETLGKVENAAPLIDRLALAFKDAEPVFRVAGTLLGVVATAIEAIANVIDKAPKAILDTADRLQAFEAFPEEFLTGKRQPEQNRSRLGPTPASPLGVLSIPGVPEQQPVTIPFRLQGIGPSGEKQEQGQGPGFFKEEMARIAAQVQAEADAHDITIPIDVRIDRVKAAIAAAQKQLKLVTDELGGAKGLGDYKAAYAEVVKLQKDLRNLQKEDTQNQIKEITERYREEAEQAKALAAIKNDLLNREQAAQEELFSAAEKNAVAIQESAAKAGKVFDLGSISETEAGDIAQRELNLRQKQARNAIAGLTGTAAEVEQRSIDSLRRAVEILYSVIKDPDADHKAREVALALQDIADKTVGLDKAKDSLLAEQAAVGLVGGAAAQAAAAARLGYSSFAALAQVAGEFPENKKLQDFVTAIRNLGVVVDQSGLAKLENDIKDANAQLDLARVNFGKTGEEALRNSLAIQRYKLTFDQLAAAQDVEHQKAAQFIADLARIQVETQRTFTTNALIRAGFEKNTAAQLAVDSERIQSDQRIREQALQTLEVIGSASEKAAADELERIRQISRVTGDYFTFVVATAGQAVGSTKSLISDLADFATQTFRAMEQSLTTFFTEKFQNNANALKNFWKNLLGSIESEIAKFLASQVVKSFVNLLIGAGTATFGGGFTNAAAQILGQAVGGTGGGGGGGGGTVAVQGTDSQGNPITIQLATTVAGQVGSQAISAFTGTGAETTGGLIEGLKNLGVNFAEEGVGGALFGLPASAGATQITTAAGTQALSTSVPEVLRDAGLITDVGQTAAGSGATGGFLGGAGVVSNATVVLAAVAAAYNIATAINDLVSGQNQNAAIGGLAGAGVGAAGGAIIGSIYPGIGTAIGAILGAALGSSVGGILGGLFPNALTHAQREAIELGKALRNVTSELQPVAAAHTFRDLGNALSNLNDVAAHPATAVALGFKNVPPELLQAGPQPANLAQFGGQALLKPATTDYPTISQETFFNLVRARPEDLFASIQQGVAPDKLAPSNDQIRQTIIDKVKALDALDAAISEALNKLLETSIAPAVLTAQTVLSEQATAFRTQMDALIAANQAQIDQFHTQLLLATDPVIILQNVAKIKDLIEARYNDEITLVKKFADQLDQLSAAFKELDIALGDQILNLQIKYGLNPQGAQQDLLTRLEDRFHSTFATFQTDQNPNTAKAVSDLGSQVLDTASQLFDRSSGDFQAIFNDVIDTLTQLQGQTQDIEQAFNDALVTVIGDGNTIAELTANNTTKMADDIAALRAEAEAQLRAAGFLLGPTTAPQTGTTGTGTPPPPQGAEGIPYVPATGIYKLHASEAVLNPSQAAAWRGGGAVSLTIAPGAITITGVSDPEAAADLAVERVMSAVRTGRLGRVIKERVA